MNEAKALQAAYQKVAQLLEEQQLSVARRDECQARERAIKEQLGLAERKRVEAVEAYLGGAGSEAEVIRSEEELRQLGESLQRCQEMLQKFNRGANVGFSLVPVNNAAASARIAYCDSVVKPIAAKAQKAAGALLLEAYAMRRAAIDPAIGAYGSLPWDIFLESIFPEPTGDKAERVLEAARSKVENVIGAGK